MKNNKILLIFILLPGLLVAGINCNDLAQKASKITQAISKLETLRKKNKKMEIKMANKPSVLIKVVSNLIIIDGKLAKLKSTSEKVQNKISVSKCI